VEQSIVLTSREGDAFVFQREELREKWRRYAGRRIPDVLAGAETRQTMSRSDHPSPSEERQ
jgi:hypothetical protein